MTEHQYLNVERLLQPLAEPLPPTRPGDWLADHYEKGQTFRQYLGANPVRRDRHRSTIYVRVIGALDPSQEPVVATTAEYLSLLYDAPVVFHPPVPAADVPDRARREHPTVGYWQLLAPYLLDRVLLPDLPDDALVSLALTPHDLWAGDGWNFVFGFANLWERVAVLSLYRNGDTTRGEGERRLCVRRTVQTAAHEVGHALTLMHCTAHRCLMNGANGPCERDTKPLNPCPVCLRKLLWNLRAEPRAYLERLAAFCARERFPERDWFARAADLLGAGA